MRIKYLFFILGILALSAAAGFCQDFQQMASQAAQTYGGNQLLGQNALSGFSLNNLIAGIIFGGIGFIAFIYGKKNSEFRPMIVGVLLMAYPYCIKDTLWLYLTGIILTGVLFFWRE